MLAAYKPKIEIIAGPNGSGKSTFADALLKRRKKFDFINADTIAKGLNASDEQSVSVAAGKTMLKQIKEHVELGHSFAFETTLSGKTWIRLINQAKKNGFEVIIHFLLLNSSEEAIDRIKARVQSGGHGIPTEVVKRRFFRSKEMFCQVYKELADKYYIYDNSKTARIIALKDRLGFRIIDSQTFSAHFINYSL